MNILYLIISLTGIAISYMSLRETISVMIDLIIVKKGDPEDLKLSECDCDNPNCEMKGLSGEDLIEQKYNLHNQAVEDLSITVFNNVCFALFYSSITALAISKYLNHAF